MFIPAFQILLLQDRWVQMWALVWMFLRSFFLRKICGRWIFYWTQVFLSADKLSFNVECDSIAPRYKKIVNISNPKISFSSFDERRKKLLSISHEFDKWKWKFAALGQHCYIQWKSRVGQQIVGIQLATYAPATRRLTTWLISLSLFTSVPRYMN